jgi:Protein kinase domain
MGTYQGQPFFTMPFLEGGSLNKQVGRFADDPKRAAALVVKVARAVQAAHDAGVLHRDLKPGNVLLDERGEPLVSDFGLAKVAEEGDLTRTDQVLGTPAYMAPELVAGHARAATRQSEVWALGVILFQLATGGQRPFPGEGKEVIDRIVTGEPIRPRHFRPGLDRALETVILKCLRRAPAERYGSAGELADDLGRWQQGEAIRARPEGWLAWTWRRVRRRPLLSAAVLLLLGGSTAVALVRDAFDPDRPWRPLKARLARGEETVLIPEAGPPPAGGRVWEGAGVVMDRPPGDANPACTVSTFGTVFLGLAPNPHQAHYLLSADVQHAEGEDGRVGLFFLASRPVGSQGPEPCACLLTFNDWKAVKRPALPEPDSLIECQTYRRRGKATFYAPVKDTPFTPAGPAMPPSMPWHHVAVEVSPEQLSIAWDDKRLGPFPRDEVRQTFLNQKHTTLLEPFDDPAVDPPFDPESPLGLVVVQGRGYFKNVVLTPLP